MDRLMDCLLDFASRNGPPCRPPGPQATPLWGALRVHNLSTPTGCAWKTLRVSHTAPCIGKHQQVNPFIEIGHGSAALAAVFPALAGE
jgi:hypothetical protein